MVVCLLQPQLIIPVFTPLASSACTAPSGKTFAGWLVSGTSDVKPAGTAFTWTYTGSRTLTAQWNAISYSIDYRDGDCSSYTTLSGLSPTTYNVTQNVTLPTSPTKAGYTFNGWCDTCNCANGTTTSWTAGSRTGNQTLYAKWTANSYSINYRDSDCTTALSGLAPTTYTVTQNVTLPTPTKTGYTFNGWCDNSCNCANGINSWTAGARTGTRTLSAKWTANTIGLSWDGGGTPQFCTYGDTFNVPTPTSRTGYVFTGWQIDN